VPSEAGAKLYTTHCAACHGDRGEGVAGAYPALAGNRAGRDHAAGQPRPHGPARRLRADHAGHPRPYGMPPFATVLSDEQVGQVLSHLRASWGHHAPQVSTLDVSRYRGAR
jgi:mono/diheme cytochrome c family protein